MSPMQDISTLFGGHHKPWLARKTWRERRIVSHGARGCFFALAIPFFGFPAILSLTFGIVLMVQDPQEGVKALLVGAIFGGALAGVTYWWLNWRKFGKSVCHLETLPGVIGGWFKASVEVRLPVDAFPAVLVSLANYKIVPGRPPIRIKIWETTERVFPDRLTRIQGDMYRVPVRFQIPIRKDYHATWMLEIRAEVTGVNLCAQFHVPIFETDEAPFVEQAPYIIRTS